MCVILHSENERSAAVSHFGGHAFSALHHLSPIKTRHTEEGGRRRRVAEIHRVLRQMRQRKLQLLYLWWQDLLVVLVHFFAHAPKIRELAI